MRRAIGTYELDDDPARVDLAAAVAFLTTQAYWGRWRGEPDIRRQIAGAWRVTGAFDQAGAMVGFARAFGVGGSADAEAATGSGSVTTNSLPRFLPLLVASTLPPCALTSSLTTARPMPRPGSSTEACASSAN